ncbi:hypothetical protein [Vibrio bathopelagicus]|uniref:hypothetical protein n=1 Tax=Vibrio bathopelagicus TaxID=2777577 RepID=UPI0018646BB0|nr:hypothetical protein [Vibrio bathopelagicus]
MYESIFFIERVISVLSRKVFGYSLIEDSFDYKPDLNEQYRKQPKFRELLLNNAGYLVDKGLITAGFLDELSNSLLSGERSGVHSQQRFPVMCALSSLSVNIKELNIDVKST